MYCSQGDDATVAFDTDHETLRDVMGPEDAPTTLHAPLEARSHEALQQPERWAFIERPTARLPLAALPAEPPQQTAARSSSRKLGPGRIGKYELREKLGRGAFGVVYTARDPSLDRDVAIKVLRPSHLTNPIVVQRFLQEARATARIAHPGIVTIHDCGQVETKAGPTAFIAMELLFGDSLTARLAQCGRLAPESAAEIVRQVASALEAAHRVDVLHRDLKPDNIYVVADPAMPWGERVKVLDFGLAKLGQDGVTHVETVFGTPHYMSPEQCRSATQIDHRSDIYSLGCILFELVTGRVPFEGEVRELIELHQFAGAPRASSLVPGVPPALDDLIGEMLAKDPMRRPQTMGAVQRALQCVVEPGRAGSAPPSELLGSGPRLALASAPAPVIVAPVVPAAAIDMSAMSGELLVPPSGAPGVVSGVGPRPPTMRTRWRLDRARIIAFTAVATLGSALIGWLTAG